MLYPSRKTHPCLDCGEETNARATVVIASGDTTPEMNWYLCEKHHTKERLIELVRQAFFVDGQGKINILMYPVNRAWSLEEAEEKYDKQNS